MSPKKFKGIKFTLQEKCKTCPQSETCFSNDSLFTTKMIIIDCEGFYHIFKELEAFERLPQFDGDLEKHKEGMIAYKNRHMDLPFLIPPLVVNGALAAELALKSLIYIENGEFDCIHNLQQLFSLLPDCHRANLTEMIFTQAHQNEETLQKNLRQIADSFENWRYFFETDAVGYTNFFNNFVHIVCDYAIALKPDDEILLR